MSPQQAETGRCEASVIVCTYRRDEVLVQTIEQLIPQCEREGFELLVVDQLARHPPAIARQLEDWSRAGRIRYFDLERSGLTHARNVGARHARGDVLIYLDDDIIPSERLLRAHVDNYRDPSIAAVAGQVLNVGAVAAHAPGSFHHDGRIAAFGALYGANFSVRRTAYDAVGGSDENLGVHAYTEDQILARRLVGGGHAICYDPAASVVHLIHASGGCRITDESQPTSEADKSFSKLYWMFLSDGSGMRVRGRMLIDALRHGPLRRQNVVQPWRQPGAWLAFGASAVKAARKARETSRSTHTNRGNHVP
jgi:glycosyltransferase involved in cell wall biosynthesis